MLDTINWALLAPLIIIQFLLIVVALVDWVKQSNTRGPKWLWLIIILFISMFGPILYFLFGRKE